MANQYDTNLKLQAIADAIGDTQSSGLIQALEDIADAVAGGGGGGSSAAGLVSDNFSETDTYDLGDYCIHNNTLYVCINAITTPGPWDLSDWQATNAGIQLSSLNSALTQLFKVVKFMHSTAVSVAAGASTTININTYSVPTGYTPAGLKEINSGNTGVDIEGFGIDGGNLYARVHNSRTSEARNAQPWCQVLFVKSGML